MATANILVVDDEKEIAELVELYLVSDGYQVHKAFTAAQGFEILEKENIDLVLLDIMMPEISGTELCLKIRDSVNVPIIFLKSDFHFASYGKTTTCFVFIFNLLKFKFV